MPIKYTVSSIKCRLLVFAPVTSRAVPPLFILASSVCKCLQCLISALTQAAKVDTHLGSLVQLCCGEGGSQQTNNAGMCGECSQWKDHATSQGTVCFPGLHCSVSRMLCKGTIPSGPCIPCTSQVQAAQGLRGSARELFPMVPAFHALPRSKLLRVSGALQGHRPRWAMRFVPVPGPSSSGDQVLGECTIPGEPCVLITSPIQIAQILGVCPESTVPDVSPLES